MVEPAPDITLVIAFAAGFLSFVSPCVLPLVPSYLIYITGLTLEELTSQTDRRRVRVTIVLNSLFFIVGLTGVKLLFSYSLGIGLPLFAIALSVGPFINYFKKIRTYMYGISVVSGVFLILVGVMLYTNSLALITGELERHGIGWYF